MDKFLGIALGVFFYLAVMFGLSVVFGKMLKAGSADTDGDL